MKSKAPRGEKLKAAAVGGFLGAVVCSPPYLLGRIGLLMVGSNTFFFLGVLLLAVGLVLEAGATTTVKAVKMSAKLVAGEAGRSAPGPRQPCLRAGRMGSALDDPTQSPEASAPPEDAAEPESTGGRGARSSLRVPGMLLRLALYDPAHIPERLTIYSVDKQADAARSWAQRVREAEPTTPAAVLADAQRRRTISTARIDGAVAGTPFFIALVPAYIAFLRQEVRYHLRVAALYGEDPADPRDRRGLPRPARRPQGP